MGDVRVTTPMLVRAGMVREQVRAEARRADPAKVLLTALALIPFMLGWVAALTVRACWAAISWTWAAIVVGWRTAYGQSGGG
jgi:hypothetical protein